MLIYIYRSFSPIRELKVLRSHPEKPTGSVWCNKLYKDKKKMYYKFHAKNPSLSFKSSTLKYYLSN